MKKILITMVAAALTLSVSTVADTTIKSTIENKGLSGVMDMQGTQQVMISGDKSKTVSDMKMTNKVIKVLGGGKPQQKAEITRLDKELFWNLDLNDKEYSELTFAEMKALFEKELKEAQDTHAKRDESGVGDTSQYTTEVKIEKPGKSQIIAGHNTDEVIFTMLFKPKDSTAKKGAAMKMVMDMWLAKDVPGYTEYKKYQKLLADKLGFAASEEGGMDRSLQGFGIDPKIIYDKMREIDGMPLMTVVSLSPEGLDSAIAREQDSARKVDSAEQSEAKKSDDQQPTDTKSKGLKKLGGLVGKKKDAQKEEPAADQSKSDDKAKPSEPRFLFHMTTIVTEITDNPIPATEFNIPVGFKKVKK